MEVYAVLTFLFQEMAAAEMNMKGERCDKKIFQFGKDSSLKYDLEREFLCQIQCEKYQIFSEKDL